MKYPRQPTIVIDQLNKGPGNYNQSPSQCCHRPCPVIADPIDGRADIQSQTQDFFEDSDDEDEMVQMVVEVDQIDLDSMEQNIDKTKKPKKLHYNDEIFKSISEDLEHHFDGYNLDITTMRKQTMKSLEKLLTRKEDLKNHIELIWNNMAIHFENKMPRFSTHVYTTKEYTKYDQLVNLWLESDQASDAQKVFLQSVRPPTADLIAYDIILEATRKQITKTAKTTYEQNKDTDDSEDVLELNNASKSSIRYMAGRAIFKARKHVTAQQKRDENKKKILTELEIKSSILQSACTSYSQLKEETNHPESLKKIERKNVTGAVIVRPMRKHWSISFQQVYFFLC